MEFTDQIERVIIRRDRGYGDAIRTGEVSANEFRWRERRVAANVAAPNIKNGGVIQAFSRAREVKQLTIGRNNGQKLAAVRRINGKRQLHWPGLRQNKRRATQDE